MQEQKISNNRTTDLLVIIVSNLVPILGATFLGWTVSDIVLLFFFETFIIGLFNVLKMVFAGNRKTPSFLKFIMIPFFLVHYNVFLLVQGVFILLLVVMPDLLSIDSLPGSEEGIEMSDDDFNLLFAHLGNILYFQTLLSIAYVFVILNHAYGFIYNYIIKKENVKTDVGNLMFAPYNRVVVQQILVIFGAIFLMQFQTKQVFLVLLVVLKTIMDIRSHNKERKKYLLETPQGSEMS